MAKASVTESPGGYHQFEYAASFADGEFKALCEQVAVETKTSGNFFTRMVELTPTPLLNALQKFPAGSLSQHSVTMLIEEMERVLRKFERIGAFGKSDLLERILVFTLQQKINERKESAGAAAVSSVVRDAAQSTCQKNEDQ